MRAHAVIGLPSGYGPMEIIDAVASRMGDVSLPIRPDNRPTGRVDYPASMA